MGFLSLLLWIICAREQKTEIEKKIRMTAVEAVIWKLLVKTQTNLLNLARCMPNPNDKIHSMQDAYCRQFICLSFHKCRRRNDKIFQLKLFVIPCMDIIFRHCFLDCFTESVHAHFSLSQLIRWKYIDANYDDDSFEFRLYIYIVVAVVWNLKWALIARMVAFSFFCSPFLTWFSDAVVKGNHKNDSAGLQNNLYNTLNYDAI